MRSLVAGWFTRTPKICTALKSVGSECLRCDIGRRWPVPKLQLDVLQVPVHLNIVSVRAGAINKLIRRPKCKCKHSESANFILCRPTRSVIPFRLVQCESGAETRENVLSCARPLQECSGTASPLCIQARKGQAKSLSSILVRCSLQMRVERSEAICGQ